jgi:hypothetical protein
MFTDFGMDAFAERGRIELQATGEHARRRTVDPLGQLTPQEAKISRLVAQGTRTERSPHNCSSARALSNTTCTTRSASWESSRERNWLVG